MRRSAWARWVVFGLTAVSSAAGAASMRGLLAANGTTFAEWVWLVLFVVCFTWISLAFWFFLAGVVVRWTGWVAARSLAWPSPEETRVPLSTRTALLVPVHNENPRAVLARVEAMVESLEATGEAAAFDFFILSDSTDPEVWIGEELSWSALRARLGPRGRVYYRHRRRNIAKKSGNIADFCLRWGRAYDFFVILDADSLMEGSTLVQAARLMQKNPRAGIIQAPPVVVGGETLFARLQQLAARLYGPALAAGLCFLQRGDSNYWGHNAIIRMAPFMEHCGLPSLAGPTPFGGHILSHDFVEAALMRRAGYEVWLAPELGGSYEEGPPSLLDHAARDRRWCHGNLQHLPLIFSNGLHPMSRLHLGMGVMSYVASVLCVAFLAAGLWVAIEDRYTDPIYFFARERTLFPNWRVFDSDRAVALGIASLSLLLAPKLLGFCLQLSRPGGAAELGGVVRASVSVVMELVWSVLLAPVMMLFQTTFVISALLRRRAGWSAQNRKARATPVAEAFKRHVAQTLIGVVVAFVTVSFAPAILPWLASLLLGLVLAVPLSLATSSERLGRQARRLGLLLVPEETHPPRLLLRARELAASWADGEETGKDALEQVLSDPLANAVHLALLCADGGFTKTVAWRAKLDASWRATERAPSLPRRGWRCFTMPRP